MARSSSLKSRIVSAPAPRHAASVYRWRVACAFCAIVTLTVIAGYYLPAYREAARLRSERELLEGNRAAAHAALDRARTELVRVERENGQLRRELALATGDSAEVAQRIERLERLISAQFARLVQAKMLVVSSAADRMSVALAVPALFATRDRLTKSGRALLCELSKTIMSEYEGQIRVTGYYGKAELAASDVTARWSSPWHLSAARASSAAEALERDCDAPPERFLVVSYGPRSAGPLGANVALEFIFRPDD
jgi:chemotaxis protein MotB